MTSKVLSPTMLLLFATNVLAQQSPLPSIESMIANKNWFSIKLFTLLRISSIPA